MEGKKLGAGEGGGWGSKGQRWQGAGEARAGEARGRGGKGQGRQRVGEERGRGGKGQGRQKAGEARGRGGMLPTSGSPGAGLRRFLLTLFPAHHDPKTVRVTWFFECQYTTFS